MPVEFRIGDVITLRKPHPCGGLDWTITRVGADIGLKCVKCSRRVMLERGEVERRLMSFVARPDFHESFGGLDAMQGLEPPDAPAAG